MNKSSLRNGLTLALGFFLVAGGFAQTPPRIPLEDFFAEPDCRAMQLAPDGRHLAFLSTLGLGRVGIALMDLQTGKYEALVSWRDENLKSFFWKGSDCIVYGGDIGGEENYSWASVTIASSKTGEKPQALTLAEAYQERYNATANYMSIIDPLIYDPLHVLVFGRSETDYSEAAVYSVDVRTGHRVRAGNYQPIGTETWDVADNLGNLRARTWVEGKKIVIEVSPAPVGRYVQVAEFPFNKGSWDLLFFAADNETLYLYNTDQTDTRTLHSFNTRTRQLSTPMFRAPEGEIENLITSWDRSTLYGVTYFSDKPHQHFFDAGRAKLQETIDATLPDTFNEVVGSSQDEQILLIFAKSDRDPGTYYVLDRAHGRMVVVGKVRSRINPAKMRPMEPVSFSARDGLEIHGYLTRPAGAAGQRVPLIVHPHGGPYGFRDNWGFDPEVQFLANRGYAVLQVNYRGSGGYGESFEHAGFHEWGGKMQDDLTDAVKWAFDQGIADPARVAIYGASYGGYATLAGLVFTPDLYCCGANYVGPSDLGLLVGLGKNTTNASARNFYAQELGDDRKYLQSRSPLNFIERLRVPLFNAYGYNDPRIDFRHWTRLEAKLKQFHKPYEILIEDNEGHGFHNEKNRLVYYRRLEAFFDRYLAPGSPGKKVGAGAPNGPSSAPATDTPKAGAPKS